MCDAGSLRAEEMAMLRTRSAERLEGSPERTREGSRPWRSRCRSPLSWIVVVMAVEEARAVGGEARLRRWCYSLCLPSKHLSQSQGR